MCYFELNLFYYRDYEFCKEFKNVRFGEFGVYDLSISNSDCNLQTAKEPVFEYGGMSRTIKYTVYEKQWFSLVIFQQNLKTN